MGRAHGKKPKNTQTVSKYFTSRHPSVGHSTQGRHEKHSNQCPQALLWLAWHSYDQGREGAMESRNHSHPTTYTTFVTLKEKMSPPWSPGPLTVQWARSWQPCLPHGNMNRPRESKGLHPLSRQAGGAPGDSARTEQSEQVPQRRWHMAERLARILQGQKENKGASMGWKAQWQTQRQACPRMSHPAGADSMAERTTVLSPLFRLKSRSSDTQHWKENEEWKRAPRSWSAVSSLVTKAIIFIFYWYNFYRPV